MYLLHARASVLDVTAATVKSRPLAKLVGEAEAAALLLRFDVRKVGIGA